MFKFADGDSALLNSAWPNESVLWQTKVYEPWVLFPPVRASQSTAGESRASNRDDLNDIAPLGSRD
jgi:hypothetical protein